MQKKAIFLFDTTGYAAEPFTKAGWITYIIDTANVGPYSTNERATYTLAWDILEKEDEIVELCKGAEFVFGFPPCTDMAVSGARHFRSKATLNPNFQLEAVHLARSVERIGEKADVPWALENPVSVLASLWRQSNFSFHPCNFGGYLPLDDVHPEFPTYIKPRDAYPKQTHIWCSQNFKRPVMKPVTPNPGLSTQHLKLGGKSAKTKRIRSASPRGFFIALLEKYK